MKKTGIIRILRTVIGYGRSVLDEASRKLMLPRHYDCGIVSYNIFRKLWAQHVGRLTDGAVVVSDAMIGEAQVLRLMHLPSR